MLGNASGGGGVLKKKTFSTALSIFSSFFFSSFPFSSFFSFSLSFALSFLLFPFPEIFFFFFEGAACTVRSQDVWDGTIDCNFSESIVSSLK